MKTLIVRPEGAKIPASISPEDSSPLILINASPPDFEPPDPSCLPPDEPPEEPSTWHDPGECHVPPLYRNASRRALQAHRFRLVACQYEAILLVALNRNCLEIGHTLVAQGGVAPARISLARLVAKADAMEAAGIILMQNRPGRVANEPPIDPSITLDIAVFCDLAGIPLIEHMYINRHGWPFFVRERGILNKAPELLVKLREGKDALVKSELGRGICCPEYYERKKAAKALAEAYSPVDITTRRRR